MTPRFGVGLLTVGLLASLGPVAAMPQAAPEATQNDHPNLQLFFNAVLPDGDVADASLDQIAANWSDGYAAIVWDLLRFVSPPSRRAAPGQPGADVWRRLVRFLEKQTGQRFGNDMEDWHQWLWSQPYDPHPDYAEFKGIWYGEIDPRFRQFFPPNVRALIRLDEVDWGGVGVNGIPPLEYPDHVTAADADYLDDDNLIFGISVEGETRAYPKRILAWHELALDRIGGVELTIVYCTLCGIVVPYDSVVDGRHLTFGTSGFLYRSNKVMFDHETNSLWNTFEGKPVIGELAESGLRLTPRSVVTTTWGEWRVAHPETTVLSLETGHDRDYSEGAAYKEYFSTDALMFPVPFDDDRLRNKDEVVVMLLSDATSDVRHPLAVAVKSLDRTPVLHIEEQGHALVVVTSESGANRVYEVGDRRFADDHEEDRIADRSGRIWDITEEALVAQDDDAVRLERVPAQRAFWFGWHAQFPNTRLVQ